ncbi:hypothetical protein ECSTECEH250_5179 [Escherichia coli STEC_EH250]|nr:hypothetical protein ECSTECEH250_5179 [Escherichia coli STEC_EH250]
MLASSRTGAVLLTSHHMSKHHFSAIRQLLKLLRVEKESNTGLSVPV